MAESPMSIEDILKELSVYTGKFPEAAVRAAVDQREAITPHLLAALEEIIARPAVSLKTGNRHLLLYALHLLAQFRERKAFPLFVKLAALPADLIEELLGETIPSGLPSMFVSVYDGDLEALVKLVLQRDGDPFVSSSAADAIALLFYEKIISRDTLVATFRRLFAELTPDDHGEGQAWNGLVSSVADTQIHELMPQVRDAFDRNLPDPSCIGLEDIEEIMADAPSTVEENFKRCHHIITDTVAEMDWWVAFNKDETESSLDLPAQSPNQAESAPLPTPRLYETYTPPPPPVTIKREAPKIGRNDPCPCGSGKKYKKCCLA